MEDSEVHVDSGNDWHLVSLHRLLTSKCHPYRLLTSKCHPYRPRKFQTPSIARSS